MTRRPNPRRSEAAVRLVTLLAALAAAAAPAGLTGSPLVDAIERGLIAAFVTYVGAHGRRISWLAAAALLALSARGSALAILLTSLVIMVVISVPQRRPRALGALAVGLVVQVPMWSAPGTGAVGAALAAGSFVLLIGSGLPRLRTRRRRVATTAALGFCGLVLLAGVGAVVAMALAVRNVQAGTQSARSALSSARDGDATRAKTELGLARDAFSAAQVRVQGWITAPSLLVPGMAQQVRAVRQVVEDGHQVAATGDDLVATADYDSLKYAGRVDVDKMGALARPTHRAGTVLRRAHEHLKGLRRGWLLPPLNSRVGDFSAELMDAQRDIDLAGSLLDTAPALLGADGPRHYLVAFLTPAELRGGGGFVGSFAELEAVDGKVRLVRSGRTEELIDAVPPGQRKLTGPPDYLRRYGRNDPADFLQDATYSPDFPSDASVLAQLYPQSGGRPVDGVIGVDPVGLAALLRLTGPVAVEGLKEPLSADNAVEVLLRRQYLDVANRAERGEILANATRATFERLTKASLPAPRTLGNVLSPVARQGHLRMWSPERSEQELFERLGADGSLRLPEGADGFSVVQQNLGNNKLDAYLHRRIDYQATVDVRTGGLRSTLSVQLSNDVPSVHLPPAVVDNTRAAPAGTNLATLSLYTRQRVVRATIDGEPLTVGPGTELGIGVWDTSVIRVPPGRSVTVTFELLGSVDLRRGYRFAVLPQPVANPDLVRARVALRGGRVRGESGPSSVVVPAGPLVIPADRVTPVLRSD